MITDTLKRTFIILPLVAIGLAGCQTPGGGSSAIVPGAAIGGLAGAGIGAAIGGDATSAVIGGLIGTAIGGLIGAAIDESNREAAIRNVVVTRTDSDGTVITSRPIRTYKKKGKEIRVVRTTTKKKTGETTVVIKENVLVRSASGEVTAANVI
jgi:outer membrane lipoprotein SlyB